MIRVAMVMLLVAGAIVGQEPPSATTRPQALLGVVGDVDPNGAGFKVEDVVAGAPATQLARADAPVVVGTVRPGDIVVRVDGRRFRSWRQWYDRLNGAVSSGDGIVRITVRNAAGTETVWLVRPTVAEVDVSSDPAPLVVVPTLSYLPAGELAKIEPGADLKARATVAEVDKLLAMPSPPEADYSQRYGRIVKLRELVAQAQQQAQAEIDERAKALNDAQREARAKGEERAKFPELRARIDELELKTFAMDDALRAAEERVTRLARAIDRLGRGELAGTWAGELKQGSNKITVTVRLSADGQATNEASNGLSGKGTWTRDGDTVVVTWSTREVARWSLEKGKLASRGKTNRGDAWELLLERRPMAR